MLDEIKALTENEKQIAINKIIDLSQTGSIVWKKTNYCYFAEYTSKFHNTIEVESFTEKSNSQITMTKVTITNQNGKIVLHNGDFSQDAHRRLLNVINLQMSDCNILSDFL